jgi:hypothetical protein
MKTKKDILYSFNHTRKRLEERYGIFIEFKDYTEMCERVDKKKNVKFISEEKQKKDVQQIYDMSFKGAPMRVVWSRANRCIKTVLPK